MVFFFVSSSARLVCRELSAIFRETVKHICSKRTILAIRVPRCAAGLGVRTTGPSWLSAGVRACSTGKSGLRAIGRGFSEIPRPVEAVC